MSDPDARDHDPEGPADPDQARRASELEQGVEHLSRVMGGVMTRLLGERVTGLKVDPETPVLGPEADRALDQVGETFGRWLNAAGEGLRAHPGSPVRALDEATRQTREPLDVPSGEAPLTVGLRSLARGLYRSTEYVLDQVAPRRPKAPADGEDATADPSADGEGNPGDNAD